ncbi:unnamed protein product [Coregonus sp. 'balchen']|nr:unnamed protein product [Coregonus sp. 'balchen']
MEPVYGAVFSAVLRDAEVNVEGKLLSVSVALLEEEETGSRLSYVACTTEDGRQVLNKMHPATPGPCQVVSSEFCRALQHVATRCSILHVVESASLWLHSRVSAIHSITTYLMEPSD